MGAATSSQSVNASGALYNPAILAHAPRVYQINYTDFVTDIYATGGTIILNTPKAGKIALIGHYLNYGSFTERDAEGTDLGTFTVGDYHGRLAYGTTITEKLSLGVSLGYSQSQLADYTARALLATAGLQYYHPSSTLAIGISYHNFGKLLSSYSGYREEIPSMFLLGVSKKLAHLPMILSVDLMPAYQEEYIGKIGGEFFIGDNLFLRWGTSTRRFQIRAQETLLNFFAASSAGIGLRSNRFRFDIAFVGLGDAGTISSVSIGQHFK